MKQILWTLIFFSLIGRTLLTPDISTPNQPDETTSDESEEDDNVSNLEQLYAIPEDLIKVSSLLESLNNDSSAEIYQLRNKIKNGQGEKTQGYADYVIVPLKKIGNVTNTSENNATYKNYMVQIRILSMSHPPYSTPTPIRPNGTTHHDLEDSNEPVPEPFLIQQLKASELKEEFNKEPLVTPEQLSQTTTITTDSPSTSMTATTKSSTHSNISLTFSNEVRRPVMIIPRYRDSSNIEKWTAKFLSWFTIALYITLILAFAILIVLHCCCANVREMFRNRGTNFGSPMELNQMNPHHQNQNNGYNLSSYFIYFRNKSRLMRSTYERI